MRVFTATGLQASTRCLPVEDIVYLPRPALNPESMTRLGEEVLGRPELKAQMATHASAPMAFLTTVDLYETYCMAHQGQEPEWVRGISADLQRILRFQYAIGEGYDAWAIVPELPRTGIGYLIQEGGLTEDVIRTFGLARLQRIRQLGFLHDPVVHNEEFGNVNLTFPHTRYCHVLDVRAILRLMAENLALSDEEKVHLEVAGLTHDALTPAGGDTVKLVDRQAFDEDANYPELFQRFDWSALQTRYRLDASFLATIVQGLGKLGQLLNLADKISYVARDTDQYLGRFPWWAFRAPTGYERAKALTQDPLICGWWDSLQVHGETVAVTDPERFGRFLELRALLFRDLYANPASRFLEHTISSVVVRYFYERGELTRDILLRITDDELERRLSRSVRRMSDVSVFWNNHPEVELFPTRAEALARETEIRAGDTNRVALLEEWQTATKTGCEILVEHRGRVASFEELFPKEAARITAIHHTDRPFRLYSFDVERLDATPAFRAALAAHYRRERATSV
ncbi:MAG TPA: hypothetical protein VJL32_03950 [Candidatus Paceibacterota bacterium]